MIFAHVDGFPLGVALVEMHDAAGEHQERQENGLHRRVNEPSHHQEGGAEAEEDGRREEGFVGSMERRLPHAQNEDAEDGEEEEDVACDTWLFWGEREVSLGCLVLGLAGHVGKEGDAGGGLYLIGLLVVQKYRTGCRGMLLRC